MKKIIGIMAVVLISATSYAQTNALDKYFSSYQENEDFTKVNVSGKMFEMASFLESTDEDVNEITDFASGVESLRMLIGHEIGDGFGKYNSALNKVKNNYEELMSVDDKEGKFTFFITESQGIVSEFVVVGAADSMLVLVSLTGQIDLKKLGSISKKIQTEGFDYIGKMNENGASQIKLYPNPSSGGGTINLDLPEDLNGADLKIYSTSGKVVKTEKVLGTEMTIDLDGLKPGAYVLDFTKDGVSIKKKLMVN